MGAEGEREELDGDVRLFADLGKALELLAHHAG